MLELIKNDPDKWAKPLKLSSQESKVIQFLIECDTQKEASKKCCMSIAYFEKILMNLRLRFGCSTNIQLIVKINREIHTVSRAA